MLATVIFPPEDEIIYNFFESFFQKQKTFRKQKTILEYSFLE